MNIQAFKGFNSDWTCLGFQYKEGETYTTDEEVVRCASGGFHSCENPMNVLSYYPPGTSRYAAVVVSGKIDRDAEDSKIASASITIGAELTIPKLVEVAIAWATERAKAVKTEHSTGDQSASSATGYRSASSADGKAAVAINIGYEGRAMAGEYGAIVLVNHNGDGTIRHIRASKVGENGIKAGVWYVLDDAGEFQEWVHVEE